jgi:hypothetical protein
MNPDPIIGRLPFVDGPVRPVFADDGGSQYIIDTDGHTRVYGAWLPDGAEEPLVAEQTLVFSHPVPADFSLFAHRLVDERGQR